jgi:hypothetical protein
MPVYKEGLKRVCVNNSSLVVSPSANMNSVIIPTVMSLLAAVKNYEEHGGTASIYINDDGMQLVKSDLAECNTPQTTLTDRFELTTCAGHEKPSMS